MLDYSGATGPPQEVCRLIVARLLQNSPVPRADTSAQDAAQSSQQQRRSQELRQLREDFFQLASERDRNRAGLALEKLLNRLFETFELRPRQPFRVVGEQMDGFLFREGCLKPGKSDPIQSRLLLPAPFFT
jgi:hypothetical protein